jgi:polyribonucleotide nucleotidyltransferase
MIILLLLIIVVIIILYRNCTIKGVHTFGVFAEVLPGYEGLVHISELDTKKVLMMMMMMMMMMSCAVMMSLLLLAV